MRIDAHQSFCDPRRFDYTWMPPEASPLRRPFLPEDLQPILLRNRFDGSIAVQRTAQEQEAEWLLELADANAFILGAVTGADLGDPKLGTRLDALQRHRKFRGVSAFLTPEARSGLKELETRALTLDLFLRPQDIAAAGRAIEEFPSLRVIVNDFADPSVSGHSPDVWAKDMEELAQQPNVFVKLSGRPYVQHLWKTFGPERCLFGSGWPVCLQSQTWKQVLASFTQALGPVPMVIRNGVMGENAVRFYRLSE